MIVDGINLIDGVIQNAAVESGTSLPVANLEVGRLFFLTQLDGASSPGLYIFNGTEWESSGETGDIESVIASTGLLGGGNSGDVTLEVDTTYVATKTTTDGLEANKVNRTGDTMTGNLNMSDNFVTSLADPVSGTDAANKQYVDGEINAIDFTPYVQKSGSALTGDLTFAADTGVRTGDAALSTDVRDNVVNGTPSLEVQAGAVPIFDVFTDGLAVRSGKYVTLGQDPTLNLHAATKQYVDSEITAIDYSAYLQKAGGTMTGALILDSDPSQALGAATKQYVDDVASTLDGNVDNAKVSKSGDSMSGFLTLHDNPINNYHASTKLYVDNEISAIDFTPYLQKAGGTVTGNLAVNGQLSLQSAFLALGEGLNFTEDENYFGANADGRIIEIVDNNSSGGGADGGLVFRTYSAGDDTSRELLVMRSTSESGLPSGDTFTWRGNDIWHAGRQGDGTGMDADLLDGVQGSVYARQDQANTFSGFVTLHADPTQDMHAATKKYVDGIATGLDFKQSVRVATTENITLSGNQMVDGLMTADGMRILVKDQTDKTENGIYEASSGAWVRSSDADNTPSNEVSTGMFTFVEGGSTNISRGYVLATVGAITLGTTELTFSQFSGAGQIEAGNGLQKDGDTLSIGSGSGIQVDVNGVSLFGADPRNVNHANVNINAGTGLTGGGDITTSRTLNVGEGTGISVNASAVSLDLAYTDGRYVQHPANVITTSSMTASANQNVFVDTTGGQVTINLPSSPSIGDQVTIIDVKGTFDTNKCIVGRNGQVIMSLPENMDITTENASVTLIYSQASTGWRIKY